MPCRLCPLYARARARARQQRTIRDPEFPPWVWERARAGTSQLHLGSVPGFGWPAGFGLGLAGVRPRKAASPVAGGPLLSR